MFGIMYYKYICTLGGRRGKVQQGCMQDVLTMIILYIMKPVFSSLGI